MSQLDRHLTTEQLSALLDSSFSTAEEYDVPSAFNASAHLENCEQCQQGLAELRQTVALLRALPQPQLPRSFALPVGIIQNPAAASPKLPVLHEKQPVPTTRVRQRQRRRSGTLNITLRMASGLAAVVGVLFILSGLLNFIPFLSSTGSSYGGISNVSPTGKDTGLDKNGGLVTPDTINTNDRRTGKNSEQPHVQPAATPTAKAVPKQPASQSPSTQANSQPATSDNTPAILSSVLNGPEKRMGIGILLFLLGSIGFTFFRQRGKLSGRT